MANYQLFLLVLLCIFALPVLTWRILGRKNWAPLVVIQILTGILLGPGILGHQFPDLYGHVFASDVIVALNGVALWAVMMFVWIAGIELDLKQAWEKRGETGMVATLGLLVPLAFGTIAGALLLQTGGWQGPNGHEWQVMAGIGMACAVTALPILVLFMENLGILRTDLGQRILRYAALDDIAIWGVLAVVLLNWDVVLRQLGFILVFIPAAIVVRRVIEAAHDQERWLFSMIWLAMCGFAADWAGLHYMVGAFLSGIVLDARWFGTGKIDSFRNTILITVMPVFFLSTGLRTSWEAGGFDVLMAAALLLAAAVSGKLVALAVAGRILGWPKGQASIVGWLLQTKALIMIIFANILLDAGIISSAAFTALLMMAVGSTMLTMPFVAPQLKRLREKLRDESTADALPLPDDPIPTRLPQESHRSRSPLEK